MLWTIAVCYPVMLFLSCQQTPAGFSSKTTGWVTDSTAHFVLYAQEGVRSGHNVSTIARQLEQTQDELLRLLHESARQRLQLYFLKDRETLTAYTGFPANGYTDTEKGIVYFVDKAPFHLAFRHELMHALSWRLWGPPKGYWLSEGLAVFASGTCGGYSLHSLARAIREAGKFTAFQNLTDTFDFKAVEPSLQGASMVKYIYDTYGVNTLKNIWQNGLPNERKFTGISLDELQRGWLAHINRPGYRTAIDWNNIHASGCE